MRWYRRWVAGGRCFIRRYLNGCILAAQEQNPFKLKQNGIYRVTSVGSDSESWVLTMEPQRFEVKSEPVFNSEEIHKAIGPFGI